MMLIKVSELVADERKPNEMEILIDNARLFYLAGGVLNFKDWVELNKSERLAFIKARESFGQEVKNEAIVIKYVDRLHSLFSRNLS